METIETLSSTDETVRFTPKYDISIHNHHQTKTTDLSKSRKCFLKRQKWRNLSKPTDSTSTLLEDTNISQSLNNYNLKLSLKSIYDYDPVAQLKQIFKSRHQLSPKMPTKDVSKNFSGNLPRRTRAKVDSIFQQSEAELIMNELKIIKSPEVWQQVVQKFKQKPSSLMDLIPIE